MTRPLDSDTLGEKGERRFGELCADARLIANFAGRDRTGWDCRVEFPFDNASLPFDKRPPPLVCDFQIKTRWSGNERISARLSSLEKLAKRPTPSFIYLLTVSETLEFEKAEVIHVADDFLAFVLKQLRQTSAKGTRPNNKEISFDPRRYGVQIPPTGEALATFVRTQCNRSTTEYANEKSRQLDELGYEKHRLKIETTFLAKDHEEIQDAFLGLRPIEVQNVRGFEERFGISLSMPELSADSATFEISPSPIDRCEVRAELADGTSLKFPARLFAPPPQMTRQGSFRFLIKTKFFDINVRSSEDVKKSTSAFNLSMSESNIEELEARPSEWRDYFNLMNAIYNGSVLISMKPRRMHPLKGTISGSTDQDELIRWKNMAAHTARVARLFEISGTPNRPMRIVDTFDCWKDVWNLYQILEDENSIVTVGRVDPLIETANFTPPCDILYFWLFPLGSGYMYYCTRGVIQKIDATTMSFGGLSVVDITHSKTRPADLKNYLKRMQAQTRVSNILGPMGVM